MNDNINLTKNPVKNPVKSSPISNFAFAWSYLKEEKKSLVLALVFVLTNALLQLLTPIAIEFLINNAIKKINYTLLTQVILGMCLIFLIQAGIFRTQVKTVGYAAQRIMMKIRSDLFGHIQKLKLDYFNNNQSGDLISRINSDTTLLDNFLGQYLFSFTSSFFVFLAFGIYMLYLNWSLSLLAFGVVGIVVLISYFINPIVTKINKKGLAINGELKAFLANNLNNYQVIQAYNIQDNLVQEFDDFNVKAKQANFVSRIFVNFFNPIYNLAGNVALVLILFIVFWFKIGENPLYLGTLIAFLIASDRFFSPLRELGTVFGSLSESMSALGRIREILNEPTSDIFEKEISQEKSLQIEGVRRTGGVKKDESNSSNAIEFSSITFQYPNNPKKVLNNISFQVPINSKFAIIGPTGEGKSTIAKLISGLLSPNSGTIKIMDKELKNWSQSEFYSTIGFILQDPFLFTGTVAQNIVYGNPHYEEFATSEFPLSGGEGVQNEKNQNTLIPTLIQDIRTHNLDSIIPNLEDFLSIQVNNNSQNISQGQKQIINFVRVLLREPKILILDEATANLDTITEQYLQQALDKLTNKVTQIIIAHRQNTIKDADYIMEVGGGSVNVRKN